MRKSIMKIIWILRKFTNFELGRIVALISTDARIFFPYLCRPIRVLKFLAFLMLFTVKSEFGNYFVF